MTTKGSFLVPDFYKDFACKCGDCRISCCEGWDISISQKEYYDILSLSTSAELQSRIMRAFYVPKSATPDRFAVLNHDWLGRCPLRGEDGLCLLQVEKGEEAIPQLCKQYPRSIRPDLSEATLSNSCEAVIESLLDRSTPIKFIMMELPFDSTGQEPSVRFALRLQCIGMLQDRRSTLKESILSIVDRNKNKQSVWNYAVLDKVKKVTKESEQNNVIVTSSIIYKSLPLTDSLIVPLASPEPNLATLDLIRYESF